MTRFKILFVCMGNICRSPTAHAVMRQKLMGLGLEKLIEVDSAGTHDYHVGHPPDRRSVIHALNRGYPMNDLRARQVHAHDFETFDLILAMDADNLALLEKQCPLHQRHKLRLFLEFAPGCPYTSVPDPYSYGEEAFEEVLDLSQSAVRGLLRHLSRPDQAQILLPHWQYHRQLPAHISRSWSFPDFDSAMNFVTQVAREADEQDHHPEIRNVHTRVDLFLHTHDVNEVTIKDIALAHAIDHLSA